MNGNDAPDRIVSGAAESYGEFAPGYADFTEDVLFGDLWLRPDLAPKLRSLVTVACLTALGARPEHLDFHLRLALKNGVTEGELVEALTHLAFYTGWSRATSALGAAHEILRGDGA